MENSNIKAIYDILNSIPVTPENEKKIDEIKHALESGKIIEALEKIKVLTIAPMIAKVIEYIEKGISLSIVHDMYHKNNK